MNTDNQQKETQTDGTPTPRRHIWRVVKWLVAAVAAVLVLVCAVVGTVVAYLQPARLTPLVCKYADEYLLADIEAAKVELSFWSTFPKLTVSIDTLCYRQSCTRPSARQRDIVPACGSIPVA